MTPTSSDRPSDGDARTLEGNALRDPGTSVRSANLDRIQLGLIGGFTCCFFLAAAASQYKWIAYGSLASVTFLGLAASITLYYFLNTVAEVKEKNYSIAGAGAVFVIVFGLGVGVIRIDATEKMDALSRQVAELQDKLALSDRDIELNGDVRNQRGKTVDGLDRNLQVGVLFEGEFFSEQGEHIFVVPKLPRDRFYKIMVGDPSSRTYYVTPVMVSDGDKAPPGTAFTKPAIFPEEQQ